MGGTSCRVWARVFPGENNLWLCAGFGVGCRTVLWNTDGMRTHGGLEKRWNSLKDTQACTHTHTHARTSTCTHARTHTHTEPHIPTCWHKLKEIHTETNARTQTRSLALNYTHQSLSWAWDSNDCTDLIQTCTSVLVWIIIFWVIDNPIKTTLVSTSTDASPSNSDEKCNLSHRKST